MITFIASKMSQNSEISQNFIMDCVWYDVISHIPSIVLGCNILLDTILATENVDSLNVSEFSKSERPFLSQPFIPIIFLIHKIKTNTNIGDSH